MEGDLGGVTEMAKNTIASREMMASLPLSWYVLNKDIPTTVLLDATATKQVPKTSSTTKSRHWRVIVDHLDRCQSFELEHEMLC
jgi:hypothetical protein